MVDIDLGQLLLLVALNGVIDIVLVAWFAGIRARNAILEAIGDPETMEYVLDGIVVGLTRIMSNPVKAKYLTDLVGALGRGGLAGKFKAPSMKEMMMMGFALKFGLIDPRVMGGGGPPKPQFEGEPATVDAQVVRGSSRPAGSRMAALRGAFGGRR